MHIFDIVRQSIALILTYKVKNYLVHVVAIRGETVHILTVFIVEIHVSTAFVAITQESIVHVLLVFHDKVVHDNTSPVHVVFLVHPRYNTEISPVERRKIAKITIIKNFNTFFLAVMTIKYIINKKLNIWYGYERYFQE